MRRSRGPFQQRLVSRIYPDLKPVCLQTAHVLTMAVPLPNVKRRLAERQTDPGGRCGMFGTCSANRRASAPPRSRTASIAGLFSNRPQEMDMQSTRAGSFRHDPRSALDAGDLELPGHPDPDLRPNPAETPPQQNPCIWAPSEVPLPGFELCCEPRNPSVYRLFGTDFTRWGQLGAA